MQLMVGDNVDVLHLEMKGMWLIESSVRSGQNAKMKQLGTEKENSWELFSC